MGFMEGSNIRGMEIESVDQGMFPDTVDFHRSHVPGTWIQFPFLILHPSLRFCDYRDGSNVTKLEYLIYVRA
jgi:hypothetical protein